MNTQKLGKYVFLDGVLQPVNMPKKLLAKLYSMSMPTLRKNLLEKEIITYENHSHNLSKKEISVFFEEFGSILYEDSAEILKNYIIECQNSRKTTSILTSAFQKSSSATSFSTRYLPR